MARLRQGHGWAVGPTVLADACAFPSTCEPFGLVATEAMAKPTILGDGYSRTFLGDPARRRVGGGVPGGPTGERGSRRL